MSFRIWTLHQMLRGWPNQGGWNGWSSHSVMLSTQYEMATHHHGAGLEPACDSGVHQKS